MSSSEQWQPVVGYEGIFEVSSLGRVRSLSRWVEMSSKYGKRFMRYCHGKLMTPTISTGGYARVSLRHEGTYWPAPIHILVAEAFIGPRPQRRCVCHNNGIPHDNRLENLRYDTQSGNLKDRLQHGTHVRGERNPRAVLSEPQVLKIREDRRSHSCIAADYGVCESTVWNIKNDATWSHLNV